MRILRAADYKIMPWKNGMGSTTEIAVSPDADGLDGFDWRISMARVAADGPFSLFPGIDRTLLVLRGDGIVLSVAGDEEARLTCLSEPHSFPGDQPTSATLIGSAIVDLNIMTRRETFRHRVSRLELTGERTLPAPSSLTFLFAEHGDIAVRAGAESRVLVEGDALMLDSGTTAISLEATPSARLVVIGLQPL